MSFELMRVTAHLESAPLSNIGALNLDGLLTFRKASGYEYPPPCRSLPAPPPLNLPLAYVEHEGVRIWLASDMMLEAPVRTGGSMVKRRDGVDVDYLTGKFQRAGGVMRDTMRQIPLAVSPAATWLCVGHRDNVRNWLRDVRAIGSLRAHGYGRVRNWTFQAAEGGFQEAIIGPDGVPRRAIPAVFCEVAMSPLPLPCMPPYWHHESIHVCVASRQGCSLKQAVSEQIEELQRQAGIAANKGVDWMAETDKLNAGETC